MVFSSLLFLFFFLPITLLLYWLSPVRLRNLTLFILSLFFYAWGEPVYVFLMLISTLTDYTIGLLLKRYDQHQHKRKLMLIVSILINIGILGFFKYYGFLARNIELLTGIPMPDWDPPLPIGISFYTFQTLSYTIDVYRREIPAQRNFITFGCYVSLFPQLIAGPIVRYATIAQELEHRKVTGQHLLDGSRLFLIGLAKKVLLANNIGALWTEIQSMPSSELTVATAWIGLIAFSFQIYFDFSGYSDMARGLGRIFGFHFPINFNYPYISQSITEFWRRWHMTLGSWFREYVYIPMGGNRVGKFGLIRNIIVVWFLTGLWHGASWNFVLWGLYFGLIVLFEKIFILKWLGHLPRFLRHGYTILLILISWVLFNMESISAITAYFSAMFGLNQGLYDTGTLYLLISYGGILLICIIGSSAMPKQWMLKLKQQHERSYDVVTGAAFIGLFLLCIAYLVDATYNPFLYFRF